MSDTTSELRQQIRDACMVNIGRGIEAKVCSISQKQTDEIMQLIVAQKQRWEAEARIDEAEYWWSDVIPATNTAVIKRAEDRRRKLHAELAALDGVLEEKQL